MSEYFFYHALKVEDEKCFGCRKYKFIKEILNRLPLIDCGPCGETICRSLAFDIFIGKGEFTQCIFMNFSYLKGNKIDISIIDENVLKIWGKEKL